MALGGCGLLAAQEVTLSEVMFDPATSDRYDEFIEILNVSATESYDLSGWYIGDGATDDRIIDFGDGVVLAPGQYAVILDGDYRKNSTTYDALIPDEALRLTIDGKTIGRGGLSNTSGKCITLFSVSGEVVSQYTYSPGNRPGYSDEKIDSAGLNSHLNWTDGRVAGGTPGKQNSVCRIETESGLVFSVSPNPFSPNNDGFEDETVFHYALSDLEITLTLQVYTLSGRRVKSFCVGEPRGPEGDFHWNGCDDNGNHLSFGLYVAYIEALSVLRGGRYCEKLCIIISQ